ncbi:uncharacterized protein LOC132705383 [Cylas formicarius]|uniref:uncharacterized protein LOC132705383 n=1 Tax=Cylas formicarius TaxID=197179 RepID=UPI0029586342|nr:uncharacterized protein LOC132705383 [Cylas formicarius]
MHLFRLIGVAFLFSLLENCTADDDLLRSNSNHLDPLTEHDGSVNQHEKRTIFGPIRSGDWAKHVLITKTGTKQVIGYSPIDYKFSSVVRPLALKPVSYSYPKPQVLFRIKSKPVQGGWKPVPSAVKPILHVEPPVIQHQPVPHVDHVDHVHQVPLNHVHLLPSYPHQFPLHVDQIHQVNVPHQDHVDAVTHVDHLHPPQHLVHVPQLKPFVPSPVLFEVTKPNLGVLPLGATFPAPVLREVPHIHVSQPLAPLLPIPAPPAHHQTPPLFFEYHGTRNYLPISNGAPFLPQAVHPHQHLPQQDHLVPNFIQQQLPHFQQDLDIPQQQLPLEADDHQANYEQHQVIQPGRTDVQIPFHLPQHAAHQEGYPESARTFEGGFRPSISLEPPYHK